VDFEHFATFADFVNDTECQLEEEIFAFVASPLQLRSK